MLRIDPKVAVKILPPAPTKCEHCGAPHRLIQSDQRSKPAPLEYTASVQDDATLSLPRLEIGQRVEALLMVSSEHGAQTLELFHLEPTGILTSLDWEPGKTVKVVVNITAPAFTQAVARDRCCADRATSLAQHHNEYLKHLRPAVAGNTENQELAKYAANLFGWAKRERARQAELELEQNQEPLEVAA